MDITGLSASLLQRLISTIYPPRCVLCAAPGCNDMDICESCYQALPWIRSACIQCAIPLTRHNSGDIKCGRCLQKPPAFDHSLSLFEYDKDIVKLIHLLKFSEKLACSRLLGTMLVETIRQNDIDLPDCIMPVPLYKKRLKQRGFNQSAELARAVCKDIGLTMDVRSVVRTRDTKSQTGMDKKQRRRNIRGAFKLAQPLNVKHVTIIDDVVTTTSTVNELARVVKRAGVRRVDVWSIARAV